MLYSPSSISKGSWMAVRPQKKLENLKEQKWTFFSWALLLHHFLLPINCFSNLGVLKQGCSLESPEELKIQLPRTILGDPLVTLGYSPGLWFLKHCCIIRPFMYIRNPYFVLGTPCCLRVGREDQSANYWYSDRSCRNRRPWGAHSRHRFMLSTP